MTGPETKPDKIPDPILQHLTDLDEGKFDMTIKLRHICEVCGVEKVMTPNEAFDEGWDYPPRMGPYKMVFGRTCGNCTIDKTLWFRMILGQTNVEDLTEADLDLLQRISNEPESILVETEGER